MYCTLVDVFDRCIPSFVFIVEHQLITSKWFNDFYTTYYSQDCVIILVELLLSMLYTYSLRYGRRTVGDKLHYIVINVIVFHD